MRKISFGLLTIFCVFFFGCSTDDDNSQKNLFLNYYIYQAEQVKTKSSSMSEFNIEGTLKNGDSYICKIETTHPTERTTCKIISYYIERKSSKTSFLVQLTNNDSIFSLASAYKHTEKIDENTWSKGVLTVDNEDLIPVSQNLIIQDEKIITTGGLTRSDIEKIRKCTSLRFKLTNDSNPTKNVIIEFPEIVVATMRKI